MDEPKVGRPRKMKDGRNVNVYLDLSAIARAAELGDGNISEGIRRALEKCVLAPKTPNS